MPRYNGKTKFTHKPLLIRGDLLLLAMDILVGPLGALSSEYAMCDQKRRSAAVCEKHLGKDIAARLRPAGNHLVDGVLKFLKANAVLLGSASFDARSVIEMMTIPDREDEYGAFFSAVASGEIVRAEFASE